MSLEEVQVKTHDVTIGRKTIILHGRIALHGFESVLQVERHKLHTQCPPPRGLGGTGLIIPA